MIPAPKGWALIEVVAQDGSTRQYSRIEKNGQMAILMDCSHGETPGHNFQDFIRLSKWLRGIGLHAPEIYEEGDRFLIVEDFGNLSFKKAITPENAEDLYMLAADVLAHIQKQKEIPVLPDYYDSNVHKGHRRVIDWYVPCIRQKKNQDGLIGEYHAAWREIEKQMPPCPQGFVHADYHVENLMFLPQEKGIMRCGIIDFQGAMRGPLPYDLGNLLWDARADLSQDIRKEILGGYAEDFRLWTRILALQFHCRVIGQFIKMAAKDHKTGYLQYIPRVQNYIKAALAYEELKPLRLFFSDNGIAFDDRPTLENIRNLVAPDAF
ncbi:MAG: phosphotransferase [Alphaproteobacteria bacterium]